MESDPPLLVDSALGRDATSGRPPAAGRRVAHYLTLCSALAIAYLAAGKLGLWLATVHPNVTVVWPPTGLTLAAFLIAGPRLWPGAFLAAVLVNVTSTATLGASLALGAGNTLEGIVAASLIRRFAHGRDVFRRADDLFKFAVFVACAAAVSASIGTVSLTWSGAAPWTDDVAIWRVWWLGDAVGGLLFTPLVVLWALSPRPTWMRAQRLEALLAILALVIIALLVFSRWFPLYSRALPLTFLCVPPLIWLGFRFGPREVATGNVLLSSLAIWGTVRGFGPFAPPSSHDSLLLVQAFVGVVGLMMLGVAIAVAERKHAEQAVRRANEALEQRVGQRTATLQRTNEALTDRIREHEATEDALRRSEERYRQLFESANDIIYTIDLRGLFTSINAAGERISGYTREEAPALHIEDILAPEYRAFGRQMLARRAAGEVTPPYEVEIVTKQGRRVPVEIQAQLLTQDGVPTGVLGIARDIAERKQAQHAQHLADARLAGILDIAEDAIISVDDMHRITVFNQGAERMFGYVHREILGETLDHLLPAGAIDRHEGRGRMFGSSGATPRRIGERPEMVGRRKDGTHFPAEASISTLVLHGETTSTVIVRDVTASRELEEQLRQAQKMEAIGQLAGGIAHDFNNLLTVVLGMSELLRADLSEGDPRRQDVEEIRKAAESGAALTHQLLAFGRKQTLRPQVLSLNATLGSMQTMLQRLIGEHIKLVLVAEPQVGVVRADPTQIEQVVLNLAANARDAMPNGGTLLLETSNVQLDDWHGTRAEVAPGPYVRLAISDNGTGMDADTQARIFEPFFTTKGVGKGTGLGLASVYGIVTQSGGYISVDSEVGRGTTFTIDLPRVEGIPAGPADTSPAREPSDRIGTVLLAEDNASVRELACRALKLRGYRVLEATTSDEALALATQHAGRIDLLVTDVVMPGMGGRELAAHVTRRDPGIRILYVSGYAETPCPDPEVGEPGAAFLAKPFTPARLLAKVDDLCRGDAK